MRTLGIGAVLFALITALILMLASPPSVEAQQGNGAIKDLATNKTYAASQRDTLPSQAGGANSLRYGQFPRLSLTFQTKDSCNADIYVQTSSIYGTPSWSTTYSDSLVGTADAGTLKEIVIRDNLTERTPGLQILIRAVVAWRSTKNGFTSPTYSAQWNYAR